MQFLRSTATIQNHRRRHNIATSSFFMTPKAFVSVRSVLFCAVLTSRSSPTRPLLASAFIVPHYSQTRHYTSRSSALFSFAPLEENPPDNQDTSRWDQLYQEGEARRSRIEGVLNPSSGDNNSGTMFEQITTSSNNSNRAPPVRVVTFDLDNTLWNTGATISAANDALASFLTSHNIVQSQRTEIIMGELFNASKASYCPILGEEGSSPVLLTQLRTDALTQILVEDNEYTPEDAETFAKEAFQIWMNARYAAIPSHYSSNVLDVLKAVSELNNDNGGSPILVGAITDGNSDPRNVPALKPYFDFCINAEQVGVSKPDKRVYLQAALQYVFTNTALQDMGLPSSLTTEEQIEDVIGPWWIHIGDDFSKDIVAAKNLNMRTIWARELILDNIRNKQATKQSQKEDIKSQYTDNSSAATAVKKEIPPEKELAEFQEKINSKTVVRMAVGADDYLTSSIEKEFADAIIDNFSDLPQVLQKWHDISQQQPASPEPAAAPLAEPIKAETTAPNLEEDVLSKTKFCVFCGAKIPMVAKFCSACSKEQPAI